MHLCRKLALGLIVLPLSLGIATAHAGDWWDDGYYNYDYNHYYYDYDYYPGYSDGYYYGGGYSYFYPSVPTHVTRYCHRVSRKVWNSYRDRYQRQRVVICN